MSAASSELTKLQNQAEALTERYDQTRVNEQRAAAAYRVTQARLKHAEQQRAESRRRVATLAAEEFESGGGFDPVTAMIGDAHGPQAYLRHVPGRHRGQLGPDPAEQALPVGRGRA